jgi:hypothetical protein
VPCSAAELIVTGAVPEEVNVSDRVAVEPTATLPKDNAVELNNNCGLGLVAPVPLNWITVVPPVDEVLLIVNCPVAPPVVVGSNFI